MEGGPPGFPRDSSCPAVLWIPTAVSTFRLQDFHLLRFAFPCNSPMFPHRLTRSATPNILLSSVWPTPRSLATTCGISVDFFSSPYLDVSLQAVPPVYLCVQYTVYALHAYGFLHSDICGYCVCLRLTAAFRSLPRPSSAPNAKAFALRSSSLDLFPSELCVLHSVQNCSRLPYLFLTSLLRFLCSVFKVLSLTIR